MEGKDNVLESLIESAEEFGKTSIELLKYKALDKVTFAASSIFLNVVVFLIALIFIIILSIGVSFWIGEALNEVFLGFLIVAAFYALLAISFYFFLGQTIKKLVSSIILKQVFKES